MLPPLPLGVSLFIKHNNTTRIDSFIFSLKIHFYRFYINTPHSLSLFTFHSFVFHTSYIGAFRLLGLLPQLLAQCLLVRGLNLTRLPKQLVYLPSPSTVWLAVARYFFLFAIFFSPCPFLFAAKLLLLQIPVHDLNTSHLLGLFIASAPFAPRLLVLSTIAGTACRPLQKPFVCRK